MNKCAKCGNDKKPKNKFCSLLCANQSRVPSEETKRKISNTLRKNYNAKNGEIINKSTICKNCNLQFEFLGRNTNKAPNYCSKSCSNTRIRNKETKDKISQTLLKKFNTNKNKNCLYCNMFYMYKKKNQKFCSKSCSSKFFMNSIERKELARKIMLKNIESMKNIKRSKNEIYFYELCKNKFKNVLHNIAMFNKWDADVILPDLKIAILWNGKWHYEKITQKHSILQVQTRDKIKQKEIENAGYKCYIIKDMGRFNKTFVNSEFEKFIQFIS